jgi:hypothetical protein
MFTGGSPAMAELPGLCASVACLQVGHGPQRSAALGHFGPSVKSSCNLFLFPKFQNLLKTCKRHIYLSVSQKNMYDTPKCSQKDALCVYVNLMHCLAT